MRRVALLSIAASMLLFPAMQPAIAKTRLHPACVGQRSDLAGKRRCTCAMEAGGKIKRGGRGWNYLDSYAYHACLTQNGWM